MFRRQNADLAATLRGNIISEKRGTLTTTYAYDALGQLIRVNDLHENATWVYNYDRGGNITSKVKYAYTTGTLGTAQQTISYTYGDSNWKDKLTAYDGKTITYDAIGNPLNDGTWTYTWQAGRQLKQMSKTGTTIRYEYNHDGLRTQKFVDANNKTDATYYTYNGKNIIHVIKNSDHLHIFYDAQNRPAKVSHNGIFYTYLYNLQGDVIGLVDKDGALVVEYKYDAWGKPLSITGTLANTLGKLNPFRYRGYVYDDETGLYYLRSRYYSERTNRFINLDNMVDSRKSLLNNNMFAYGRNNSITYSDPTGHSIEDALLAFMSGTFGKSILITKKEVFTKSGNRYPLYQPSKGKGPYLSAKRKNVAVGKSSKRLVFAELGLANPLSLDDNPVVSLLNIVSTFKNMVVMAEMNVYIEEAQPNPTRARVTVQFHANATSDPFETGITMCSTIDSPVLTLIEVTKEEGIFWDGEQYFSISNNDGWLTSLISEVELTQIGGK